jgi:transposase
MVAEITLSLLDTVMTSQQIFCDGNPMPILDPGRGRKRTSQFWFLVTDDRPRAGPVPPAVAYVYTRDRKGGRIAARLEGFHGVLQLDGYAGYKTGKGDRPVGAITLAFCLAHARRRYFCVLKATQSPVAADALLRIIMVNAIEAQQERIAA